MPETDTAEDAVLSAAVFLFGNVYEGSADSTVSRSSRSRPFDFPLSPKVWEQNSHMVCREGIGWPPGERLILKEEGSFLRIGTCSGE